LHALHALQDRSRLDRLRAEVLTARDHPVPIRVLAGRWTRVTLRYLIPPYMA